jgi:hypothetical protein
MKRHYIRAAVLLCVLVVAGIAVQSQPPQMKNEPGRYIVSIYNVVAGKHLAFLKWQAQQEAIAKEAGAPAAMWFRHTDGAAWDYIAVTPAGTPTQEEEWGKKTDAIAKSKGMSTGAASQLEFRSFISNHSDTYSMGPMTAAELVKEAEKKN